MRPITLFFSLVAATRTGLKSRRIALSLWLLAVGGTASADVFNIPAGQTSLQFVTVGDPGNAPDTVVETNFGTSGYGSVNYLYQIGKYDVTAGQYTQFLIAVAASDPYGLWVSNMLQTPYKGDRMSGPLPNDYPDHWRCVFVSQDGGNHDSGYEVPHPRTRRFCGAYLRLAF